jgi:hypothetical protein
MVMESNNPSIAAATAPDTSAGPEQTQQQDTIHVSPQPIPSVASTGKRQAFQDLKRNLTEAELSNPGTQKLILEMLSNVEDDRDECKAYVSRFHEADKRVGILTEKLRANNLIEIMFTIGFGAGCAIVGLSTYFWSSANLYGQLCLAVGTLLAGGFGAARIFYALKS